MKEHCWCQMRNWTVGKRLDPEHAEYVRSGIPLCSYQCAREYDRRKEESARNFARNLANKRQNTRTKETPVWAFLFVYILPLASVSIILSASFLAISAIHGDTLVPMMRQARSMSFLSFLLCHEVIRIVRVFMVICYVISQALHNTDIPSSTSISFIFHFFSFRAK